MKKIFRMFYAAMAMASFASCAEKVGNDVTTSGDDINVEESGLVQMTFSATMNEEVESKTTYRSRNVYWEAADQITVFSVGDQTVKSDFSVTTLAEDKTWASFSGLADASAETYYAVYPHSEANTYADGTFTVNIPSVQTAVAEGFAPEANVSMAVSIKDAANSDLQFKNVGALLAFAFATPEDAANTKSVTIKAKKNDTEYWGLTGTVSVTFDDNSAPVASEGTVDNVVLNEPEGGFKDGKVYYMPVSPVGDIVGMEVIFSDHDGKQYVKRNGTSAQVLRSYIFNIGTIPSPYDDLPKDFTLTFGFAGKQWPFNEPCEYKSESGETYTYTYNYVYNGEQRSTELQTTMGYKAYELSDKGLSNTGGNSFIMSIPKIKGRYLTTITLSIAGGEPRLALQSKWANVAAGANCLMPGGYEEAGNTCVISIYNDYIKFDAKKDGSYAIADYPNFAQSLGKQYHLKLRDKGTISEITLTYSSTAPGNAPTE